MAEQKESTLSLVFGEQQEKTSSCLVSNRRQDEDYDETSSVRFIANAIQQSLKHRDTSATTEASTDMTSSSSSSSTQFVDPRLQLTYDNRGGPDFKAQADSRSVVGASVVRAQPANRTPTAPADYYGRVMQRRARCIVSDEAAPIDMIPALQCAAGGVERAPVRKKPKQHSSHTTGGGDPHLKAQTTKLAAGERRFWLKIICLATLLNVFLVSGVTALGLYLSGNLPPGRPLVPAPTAVPTVSPPTQSPSMVSKYFGEEPFDPPTMDHIDMTDAEAMPNGTLAEPIYAMPSPPPSEPRTQTPVPEVNDPFVEAEPRISALWISVLVGGSVIIEAFILAGLFLIHRRYRRNHHHDPKVDPPRLETDVSRTEHREQDETSNRFNETVGL